MRQASPRVRAAAALTALPLVLSGLVSTASAASVIPDDALRACVNASIGNPADAEPSDAQLAMITSVSCNGKGITTLEGVQRMPALQKLFVSSNKISSLEPLRGRTKIFSLGLSHNELSDISPLSTLTELSSLSVDNNRLSDLSALKDLTKLSTISIQSQQQKAVGAWAPVGEPVDLPSGLDRSGVPVDLTSTPAGVTVSGKQVTYPSVGTYVWSFKDTSSFRFNGTITVTVGGTPPTTPEPTPTTSTPAPTTSAPEPTPTTSEPAAYVLIPDAALRACIAGAAGVADPDRMTLADLAPITSLSCVGTGITSLEGIEQVGNLTSLTITSNKVSDLTPLAGLRRLTTLLAPGNQISDLEPLGRVTTLTSLTLDNNPFTSIEPLAPLTRLTDLSVSQRAKAHPGITSLKGVEGMTGLTRLVANNSRLTEVSPLAGLTRLKTFAALNNKITSVEPLRGLTELTSLTLSTNEISDVTPLRPLTKLTQLDLATNHVTDLSPLQGMPSASYMGLKARWQVLSLPSVPAGMTTRAPRAVHVDGAEVPMTAPDGVTVTNGMVRYGAPGTYTWTFADSENSFGGTITQPVGEAAAVANIPDPALRSCVAEAAGLPASTPPTDADLARITTLDCSGRGVRDLTGLEGAAALERANLADNTLAGLTPLSGLGTLRSLDLSRTGLTGLADIATMRGLDTLVLNGNHLRDLRTADPIARTIEAREQTVRLDPITGDSPAPVPTATDRTGATVTPAQNPSGATVSNGMATYALAGDYTWTASTSGGDFSVSLTQLVTRDRIDPAANAGADACLRAKNVWVVVERDTGLQEGGCATKFGTGLEALQSAGFAVTGTGFVSAINGYPAKANPSGYWSYWQATGPGSGWTYSNSGAASSSPKPGTVEGWRYLSDWQNQQKPSWTPVFPKPVLTGTPANRVRYAGTPASTGGITWTGFVDGDTQATAGITGAPVCTSPGDTAVVAGTYQLTCTVGTLRSDKYDFRFEPATVEVRTGLYPVAPARLADSRSGSGVHKQRLAPGQSVTVRVSGRAGIPTGATGAYLNVTAINPTATGWLTVAPTGTNATTSNINYRASTMAGGVMTRLGADGAVTVRNGGLGTVDVAVDAFGFVAGDSRTQPGDVVMQAPQRLVDTRSGLGAPRARIPARGSVTVAVAGAGGMPSNTGAGVLGLVAVQPSKGGYLTAYPAGAARPNVSSLNFAAGTTRANLSVVPVGTSGRVTIHNGSDAPIDVVVDTFGFTVAGTPTLPGHVGTVAPQRILDTRHGIGAPGPAAPWGVLGVGTSALKGMPPAGETSAVLGNLTAVTPPAPGWFTLYPGGGALPNVSSLNFASGATADNAVMGVLGANGGLSLRNDSAGRAHSLLDVTAYVRR